MTQDNGKLKKLVKSIKAGTCHQTHLDFANHELTDTEFEMLMDAMDSSKGIKFKQHLISLNLGNDPKIKTSKNRFSNIAIEDLSALESFNIRHAGVKKLTLNKLPKLKNIDLSENKLQTLDLSGLGTIATANIRHINPAVANPFFVPLTTVYVGDTSFSKHIEYNSTHFDPITRNIFNKLKTKFPEKYLDYGTAADIDFGLKEITDYLGKMLHHYKLNRAGVDLTDAVVVYTLWLFNPEISRPKDKNHYQIAPWSDPHFILINEIFIDRLRDKIKDFYHSISRSWTREETADFNKFALLKVNEFAHQSMNKLLKNKALGSIMRKRIGEFNKSAIAPIPHSIPRKNMLHNFKEQLSTIRKMMVTQKTTNKNKLKG